MAEGNICVVFDGEDPVAYAFYQLGESTIQCGEFVYSDYKGKRGLLEYFYNHRSQGEQLQWNEGIKDQSYRFYPDGKKGHETIPFMTGRIVDVKGALEKLSYDKKIQGHAVFFVEDPLADWNTGTFSLTVKEGKAVVESVKEGATIRMTIGALALLVFGTLDAKALAFYNKLTAREEDIDFLDRLFPKTETYINEWY